MSKDQSLCIKIYWCVPKKEKKRLQPTRRSMFQATLKEIITKQTLIDSSPNLKSSWKKFITAFHSFALKAIPECLEHKTKAKFVSSYGRTIKWTI